MKCIFASFSTFCLYEDFSREFLLLAACQVGMRFKSESKRVFETHNNIFGMNADNLGLVVSVAPISGLSVNYSLAD